MHAGRLGFLETYVKSSRDNKTVFRWIIILDFKIMILDFKIIIPDYNTEHNGIDDEKIRIARNQNCFTLRKWSSSGDALAYKTNHSGISAAENNTVKNNPSNPFG